MTKIKTGKYKHFKGSVVEVIGTALHSETQESMVVYNHLGPIKGMKANTLWVRPLKMFTEKITKDGKIKPRFEHINN